MANQLGAVFSAVADPTRRAVVERLIDGPASVTELYAPHDMALPSFLKHLGVLEKAGLVRSTKEGRVRTLTLEAEALTDAEAWFRNQRSRWERRFDRLDALVRGMEKGRKR